MNYDHIQKYITYTHVNIHKFEFLISAELLIMNRELSETEVECVEDYLQDKYKIFAQNSSVFIHFNSFLCVLFAFIR